jgi:hypothetical protein
MQATRRASWCSHIARFSILTIWRSLRHPPPLSALRADRDCVSGTRASRVLPGYHCFTACACGARRSGVQPVAILTRQYFVLRELRVARGHSLVAAGAGTPLVRDGCIHPGAAGRLGQSVAP